MESTARIPVNIGGSRSSKSYSLMQLFILYLLQGHGAKLLVIRKSLPSLRVSNLIDFKEIIAHHNLDSRIREEKLGLNYYFNDNWLHFGSLDDFRKIKSTGWNKILMEEADEFAYFDYMTLKLRLSAPDAGLGNNQLFMCLNPEDADSWIPEEIMKKEKSLEEIHSTYKDNIFLDDNYIELLEELREQDANMWRIYGLGLWGEKTERIYSNWDIVDAMPEELTETIYGLDYGFNHYTALLKMGIVEDVDVYEEELIYQRKLTHQDVVDLMLEKIPNKDNPVYCDSGEPGLIELALQSGFNIKPGDKRVLDGINFVKTRKVHILSTSVNHIKEKKTYSWMKDKNNRILDQPVKFRDDSSDAERYALYTHMGKRKPFRVDLEIVGESRITNQMEGF